jgi:predicted amidophosphoribosyltransferase
MAPWWLLLPQHCCICDRAGERLCAGCRASLVRLRPPLCERCGAPGAWPVARCVECVGRRLPFATARAGVAYDDRARRFVHEWKERGRRDLAPVAAALVVDVVPRPRVDRLTFVPGDPGRGRERGHAPTSSLARALASEWGLALAPLLRRVRRIERQRGKTADERRANVRGAFSAGDASGPIALVDDVYTTGATASACAAALRRAGANRVDVVCFARALRGR